MYSHKHYEQSIKINSERLFLRPIDTSDTDLIISWRNSSEVRSVSFDSTKLTIENHLKWLFLIVMKRAHKTLLMVF